MEVIEVPHLPEHPLHVILFKNVQNAEFLRQQLLSGNSAFEYAFLDTTVIFSRKQVLSASFRAINDKLNGRLKSHNVHSEIVFALSPNNNIAESFRRFGIQNESKNIIAIKVGGNSADIEAHLCENVIGDITAFTDDSLTSLHDIGRIRKIYKLDAPKKDTSSATFYREAETFIIGSMALKGS